MSDTNEQIPALTLEPETATATAAAVPQLTLDSDAPSAPTAPAAAQKEVVPVDMDEKLLTEEEKKAVEEFSKKINIGDSNM